MTTTTDLGTCEWFVWDIRRSNLVEREQLDQATGEFLRKRQRAEPPELAQFLVGQGLLTNFQAERLLQGKTQGFVLGPYVLMDSLGSGSMGTVYKALNKSSNQEVVVKVLPRRSMWNVRVAKKKIKAFEECRHPAIVPFIDVGTSGGTHYLVWQYVAGETLAAVVEREGSLPPSLAATYLLQCAEALELCHRNGLSHGLLKPSNLLVGADERLYILDIGVGSLLAETEGESLVDTMSTANAITSGLDCASPESITEPTNLNPAGDQYSLGCVFYYCLTGRYPFHDGSAAEKMLAHQLKQPTPIRELAAEVPSALVAVIERLMQKSPSARFGTMAEISTAIGTLPKELNSPRRPGGGKATRLMKMTASGLFALKPKALASSYADTPPPSARPTINGVPKPAHKSAIRPSTPQEAPAVVTFSSPAALAEQSKQAEVQTSPGLPKITSPDYTVGHHQEERSLEDRLGPVGVAICAFVLCATVWFVMLKVF